MKRIVFTVFIAAIVIVLAGCGTLLPYGREYRIFAQRNTDWVSEDGTMSIHVEEDGLGTLRMSVDGEEYEYRLGGLYSTIDVFDDESHESVEWWDVFYHRNWFSAKVHDSDYFEEGTKLKFYRVDED